VAYYSHCADCAKLTLPDDYLCELCRMVADGENFTPLPPDYWEKRCDRCGRQHDSCGRGRFLGLCESCKELAARTVPSVDPFDEWREHLREIDDWNQYHADNAYHSRVYHKKLRGELV
jgi:hypothetical protein